MSAALFVPDYEEYYLQELHSDVRLLITNEAGAAGDALARRLPGHSMVLVVFSTYCKAKLETWIQAGSSNNSSSTCSKPEVVLPVPAGQQELAELLVKGMYQAKPTVTDELSQQQLLQLMLLADRFGVPKVQAVVAAALAAVPVQQLQWDTAVQLLQLPYSCAQQTEFKAVQQLAVQRVQQQLGDLEEVWADEQLQQQLLSLPFEALKQLLQLDGTRVATENTVVYTIERWWGAQDAALQQVGQLRELMHLMRMRHCTEYYAGTVMPHSSLVQQSFERWALPLMRECCMEGGLRRLQAAQCSVLKQYPAWCALQRRASERQPVFEWRLPLDTLQAAVEKLISSGRAATAGYSDACVVQGQVMCVKGLVTDTCFVGPNDTPAMHLGVYVCLLDLPPGSIRLVNASASVLQTDGAVARHTSFGQHWISPEVNEVGFTIMVPLGIERSWQAVKAQLYMQQLVHSGPAAAGAAAAGAAQG